MSSTDAEPDQHDLEAHHRAGCPRRRGRARRRPHRPGRARATVSGGWSAAGRAAVRCAGQELERVDVAAAVDDRPRLQLVVGGVVELLVVSGPRRARTRRARRARRAGSTPRTRRSDADPRACTGAEARTAQRRRVSSSAPASGPPPAAATPTSGSPGHLALARLTPELHARLVEEAVAVQPTGRELAAVGVEREHAVAGDALAALDERSRLALAAEPHRLEPRHRDEREAVVHLGELHVGRLQVGAGPQLRAGVAARPSW